MIESLGIQCFPGGKENMSEHFLCVGKSCGRIETFELTVVK